MFNIAEIRDIHKCDDLAFFSVTAHSGNSNKVPCFIARTYRTLCILICLEVDPLFN